MNPTHQRQQVDTACGCGSGCAASPAVGGPMASKATAVEPHRFRIANMDCASEESEIRRALDGVAGIRGLQFNLVRQRLHVDGGVCGHGGKLAGGPQWAKVAWKAIEQVEKDVRESL